MIGADGAHSAVRFHMMKFARVNYQQEYIDTLWCEFQIPPLPKEQGGGFRLSPNHLHIWPGGEFMFIAIPSLVRCVAPFIRAQQLTWNRITLSPAHYSYPLEYLLSCPSPLAILRASSTLSFLGSYLI